jgi:hypothetical protein
MLLCLLPKYIYEGIRLTELSSLSTKLYGQKYDSHAAFMRLSCGFRTAFVLLSYSYRTVVIQLSYDIQLFLRLPCDSCSQRIVPSGTLVLWALCEIDTRSCFIWHISRIQVLLNICHSKSSKVLVFRLIMKVIIAVFSENASIMQLISGLKMNNWCISHCT